MSTASQSPLGGPVEWWGNRLLKLGLGAGLALTFILAWRAPEFVVVVPLSLVGCVLVGYLLRRPLAHLVVVLCGFVLVFNYDADVRPSEVLFGLYYMAYLGSWFTYRVFLSGEPFLFSAVDKAIAAFLLLITLGLGMTLVFGGDLWVALNQWRAVVVLGFYFPVKEACVRDPRALKAVLVTFSLVALVVVFRTFGRYYAALQDVEALYQVMVNRSRTGERLVMMELLGAIVFFLYYARNRLLQLTLLGVVSVSLAGVIIGQSRTIWIAAGASLALMFVLVSPREKVRALVFVSAGALLLVAGAVLVLDDFFATVLAGLGNRLSSIEGATSQDVSLINRFYEWRATWEASMASPLVGRGFGVPLTFFNVIYHVTETKVFIHNGYLGILFRHGFLGLALILFAFTSSFVHGLYLIKHTSQRLEHAVALACVIVLPGLGLAMTMEDMLLPADGVYAAMIPLALLSSLSQRRHRPLGREADGVAGDH